MEWNAILILILILESLPGIGLINCKVFCGCGCHARRLDYIYS